MKQKVQIPKMDSKKIPEGAACRNCGNAKGCWLYGNTICSNYIPKKAKNEGK